MKELVPVNGNVILKVEEEAEKKTAAGIILPDTAKEKPTYGKVIAVDKSDDDIQVSVGDKVIFKKYSGTEIEIDGEKYLILPYSDILAKIVETEEI